MHQYVSVAEVTTPTKVYGNAFVEISSVDDVEMQAIVRNRVGIDLEILTGPFEHFADGLGGWRITTPGGEAIVRVQQGCGCGGTSVTNLEPAP